MKVYLSIYKEVTFQGNKSDIDTIRFLRNRYLSESDWAMLPDAPTDKTAWETYRQALRDVPQNWDGSDIVEFPDKP